MPDFTQEGFEEDDSPTAEDKAALAEMSGDEPEAPAEAAPAETELAAPEKEGEEKEAAPAPVEPQVPLATLREERQKRQQYEARVRELEELQRVGEERLQKLFQQQQTPQQPTPQPQVDLEPDRETDPLAWVDWRVRQAEQANQQLQQQAQQAQTYAAQADYAQRILAAEQAARVQNPHYDQAVQHLASSVDKFLTPAFPDPQRRMQAINYVSQMIVNESMMTGRSPAQVVYETALAMGATPAEAASLGQAAQVVQQQQAPAAPQQAPVQPNLRTLNTAQRASRTLSQVAGAAPSTMPTLNDIAKMSDEEWDSFRARNPHIATAVMEGKYNQ